MASRSIICQSRRLRQIIDLRDTDKSRYFAITESLDLRVWFLNEAKRPGIFTEVRSQEGEKRGFIYAWAVLFAQSWRTLRMSRPLFVGSYLQVTWWAVGQRKAKKIRNKWLLLFKIIASLAHRVFISLNILGLCSKVLSTEHCSGRGRDYSIDLSHFLFNMFWFKLCIFIVWSSECGK